MNFLTVILSSFMISKKKTLPSIREWTTNKKFQMKTKSWMINRATRNNHIKNIFFRGISSLNQITLRGIYHFIFWSNFMYIINPFKTILFIFWEKNEYCSLNSTMATAGEKRGFYHGASRVLFFFLFPAKTLPCNASFLCLREPEASVFFTTYSDFKSPILVVLIWCSSH